MTTTSRFVLTMLLGHAVGVNEICASCTGVYVCVCGGGGGGDVICMSACEDHCMHSPRVQWSTSHLSP